MDSKLETAKAALEIISDKSLNPSEYEFARAVVALLEATQMRISLAESLTGGMAAELLTAVPGASKVFAAGIVAYSAQAKVNLLQVPANLVSQTTISADVAVSMAEGVRQVAQSDLSLACTGVAGPDSVGVHEPGEVHIALAKQGHSRSVSLRLAGGRDEIRVQTCIAMFGLAIDVLVQTLDLSKPVSENH